MILFLQQTVTGICVGLAYAMIAMGLILLLRAAGVMNFAQGNLMALGAYFAYLFLGKLHLNPAIAVILAILSLIAVGIVFCCVCVLFAEAGLHGGCPDQQRRGAKGKNH